MLFWFLDFNSIQPEQYASLYSISIIFISSLYIIFGFTLKYLQLKVLEKKTTYVTANIVKGLVLMTLFFDSFESLYTRIFHFQLGTRSLINYHRDVVAGALYASTDTVSIFLERRKSWATTFHHIGVVLGYILLMYLEPLHPICEHLLAFGNMGILTSIVNFYLGLRFLVPQKNTVIIDILRQVAFVMYSFFWSTNLLVQIALVLNSIYHHYWVSLSIVPLLVVFIYDDVLLIKFLSKHNQNLQKH
tara:strand:+ start:13723 stop:14460 length:738 start_codon:yes stop_codon:yes gene_type:complete